MPSSTTLSGAQQDQRPAVAQSRSTAKPTDAPLFLRNLRLLDLDRRQDWPSIDHQTFSTKHAQQEQRNRIKCAEWALFRLFELWDAEQTRDKLLPFFPPLEPLQSLNLRAALFRSLSELKRNGTLGRDTVLRKTSLDDCKGEKFEEVLACFSTAVLKKTLLADSDCNASHDVAARLATSENLRESERYMLEPLAIAYRVSLAHTLSTRHEQRSRFDDMASLLDLKESQITRRREQFNLTRGLVTQTAPAEEDTSRLQHQFGENWFGESLWLNELLDMKGDRGAEGILSKPFCDVWDHLENGRLGDVDQNEGRCLLEDLENRIRQQQSRLESWRAFRQQVTARQKEPIKIHKAGGQHIQDRKDPVHLLFTDHGGVNLSIKADTVIKGTVSMIRPVQEDFSSSLEAYDRLLKSMKLDLEGVGKPRNQAGRDWGIRHVRRKSDNATPWSARDTFGDDGESLEGDESGQRSDTASEEEEFPAGAPETDEPHESAGASARTKPFETRKDIPNFPQSTAFMAGQDMANHRMLDAADPQAGADAIKQNNLVGRPSRQTVNMHQDVNDQQFSISQRDLLPRPKKGPRKTRMSLLDPDDPQLLADKIIAAVTDHTVDSDPEDQPVNHHPSLVERTRMSMASVIPSATSASTKLGGYNRGVSPLLSPSQPSTPPRAANYDSGHSTPREELFSQEADYASVFRSRPKVKASPPTGSPERRGWKVEEDSPLARMAKERVYD